MTEKPTKDELYELYWEQELPKDEIAGRYDMTPESLRGRMANLGVPFADADYRDVFLFRMRNRRYYYQLYWEDDYSLRTIASQHNISQQSVISAFKQANVPRASDGTNSKWFDKDRGIPKKYKLPRDEQREGGSSVDNPKGKLPDDPTPEKYLADTPLHRDKERLYELHWGYGCSAALINAMAETENHIHEWMRKLGIPVRSYEQHKHWEPHHDGVPPMFEWPHDRGYDNDEAIEWTLSEKNMATGD